MFDKFRAVCRVSVEYSTNQLFTLNFRSSVTKVSCTGGRLDDVTKGSLIFRLLVCSDCDKRSKFVAARAREQASWQSAPEGRLQQRLQACLQ